MSPISTDMPPDGFQSITNAIVGRPLGLPGSVARDDGGWFRRPLGLRAKSACYTRQTIRNSSEKRVIPSWMR